MKSSKTREASFKIERPLGTSGHASSFLASRRDGNRRVRLVVKLFAPVADESLAETLRPDILDLASFCHPSFAGPVSTGSDPDTGRLFVARTYIDGLDLLSATEGRPANKVLPWLHAAAEALSLLHRFGLLHRNIKPANFLVPRASLAASRGSSPRVILCDAAWWPERDTGPAHGGGLAPELAGGERATFASDLYSLGAVFYQLLAGRKVEAGESGFPVPPSHLRPEVPVDIDRVVLKLLSPDPARRYLDAQALVSDLRLLSGAKGRAAVHAPECFLGRAAEIQRAVACLDVRRGQAVLAVVAEAGMGKSAFLRRLTLEAELRGFVTASVRCHAGDESPLAPVLELAAHLRLPRAGRDSLHALVSSWSEDGDAGGRRVFLRAQAGAIVNAPSSRPLLILLDDVHFAHGWTIDLLSELVREVAASARVGQPGRPSVRLALAFRGESLYRSRLEPLWSALRASPAHSLVLDLAPLHAETVATWLDLALPRGDALKDLPDPELLGGNPSAVREAIRLGAVWPGERVSPGRPLPAVCLDYFRQLGPDAEDLLKTLAVVGRPASLERLAALVPYPIHRLRQAAKSLAREGALSAQKGLLAFQHGSLEAWIENALEEGERRAMHRKIASALEASERGSVEEAARHWLQSDARERAIRPAILAARRLSRSHEDHRAIELYLAAIDLVPPGRARLKRLVSKRLAAAFSRVGQHRRGVEVLTPLLRDLNDPLEAGKLHARIGISHHRAGEVAEARLHLEKSLELLAGDRGLAWLREGLRVKSELAEISSNQGDYDRAERICLEAMAEMEDVPGARQDHDVRRARMLLLETLAHLRVRRFQYGDARQLFEESLALSEELGTVSEKCLILNNLGILHNHENRFQEAIECYQHARELATNLGDDLILVNIYSNLGLLHAKTGQVDEADEYIRRAVRHDARCESARTRFLRLHCAGIVDLYAGRYASGIETFRSAISLGEELMDTYLTAFDWVYLGECHLFRGEAKAAQGAFDRAMTLEPAPPAAIAFMVRARAAAASALRGASNDVRTDSAFSEGSPGGHVPFLHAWDQVFLGWARRLAGDREAATRELEAARAYFSRVKVPAGEIHATLELALLEAEAGQAPRGEKHIQSLRRRFSCGRGPLKSPMLTARLLAYETRFVLEREAPDLNAATMLLVEAESYLVGRSLRDLESFVRDLRKRLRRAGAQDGLEPSVPPEVSRDPGPLRELLRSFQETAQDLVRRFEEKVGEGGVAILKEHLRELGEHVQGVQRASEGGELRAVARFRAGSILGRSPAVSRVIQLLRQVAPSHLPVLITGETGTGKDLVARAIHGESRRASGPFVTLNCAALPGELLESELCGHRRGAFTGAEEDKDGILVAARGGTVLFDEIGDMPPPLQAKLLRILGTSRVRPLGAAEEVEIDVRFLFATNRDLRALLSEGSFRRDLFHRVSTIEVKVPPLRDRLEDLFLLVEHFRSLVKGDCNVPFLDESAKQALAGYPWPGNVRELENVVTHLALTCPWPVSGEHVKLVLGRKPAERLFSPALLRSRPLPELVGQVEKEYFLQLHADSAGDMKRMSKTLGVSLQALYKRFKSLGIRPKGSA